MPPRLSARGLFWTGIALLVTFVVLQVLATERLLWSQDLPLWGSTVLELLSYAGLLGAGLLAASFVVRAFGSAPAAPAADSKSWTPPRTSATVLFWTGVGLIVVRVLVDMSVASTGSVLQEWLSGLPSAAVMTWTYVLTALSWLAAALVAAGCTIRALQPLDASATSPAPTDPTQRTT